MEDDEKIALREQVMELSVKMRDQTMSNDRFYEKFYVFRVNDGVVTLPKDEAADTWRFLKQMVEAKLDRQYGGQEDD